MYVEEERGNGYLFEGIDKVNGLCWNSLCKVDYFFCYYCNEFFFFGNDYIVEG